MSSQVTLNQLEEQISQLTPREQLRLIAGISEQLSMIPLDSPVVEKNLPQQRKKEADELLVLCDAAADMWEGEFDAVEEIHQIRQRRGE